MCALFRTQVNKPLVIGIGNTLMGDDGAGARVVDILRARKCGAEFLHMATPGMGLITHVTGRDKVIFVDAAEFSGSPGEVRRAERKELAAVDKGHDLTLHDKGLLAALDYVEQLGLLPQEIIFYCIQKKEISPGERLSDEVASAVEMAADLIEAEL
jgi:hydrogenase maturation protease